MSALEPNHIDPQMELRSSIKKSVLDKLKSLLRENLNEPQIKSIKDFNEFVQYGAKTIDIKVRIDGQNYTFEGDYLKHVLPIIEGLLGEG